MVANHIRLPEECCMIVVVHCIHHLALLPSGRTGLIFLRICPKKRVSVIFLVKMMCLQRVIASLQGIVLAGDCERNIFGLTRTVPWLLADFFG
jgi:hypothetical protein